MNKIRKGDTVMVIAGKNKGLTGSVLQVLDNFVRVKDLNMAKKHEKPNPHKEQPGRIALKEMALPMSNVRLMGGKVGLKFLADGKKVRYFKKTGEVMDV